MNNEMKDLKFTTAGEFMDQQEPYWEYIMRRMKELREEREQQSKQKGE